MARPRRPGRNRAARSFRQLRRFYHIINTDRVFGTHNDRKSLWMRPFSRTEVEWVFRIGRHATFDLVGVLGSDGTRASFGRCSPAAGQCPVMDTPCRRPPARSSGRCSGLTRPPITAPRRRARPGWRQCVPRRRRACGRRWTSTSRAGAAPCGPERHGRQPGPRWQDNAVNELLTNKVRD